MGGVRVVTKNFYLPCYLLVHRTSREDGRSWREGRKKGVTVEGRKKEGRDAYRRGVSGEVKVTREQKKSSRRR